jgi:hypothetical protein
MVFMIIISLRFVMMMIAKLSRTFRLRGRVSVAVQCYSGRPFLPACIHFDIREYHQLICRYGTLKLQSVVNGHIMILRSII